MWHLKLNRWYRNMRDLYERDTLFWIAILSFLLGICSFFYSLNSGKCDKVICNNVITWIIGGIIGIIGIILIILVSIIVLTPIRKKIKEKYDHTVLRDKDYYDWHNAVLKELYPNSEFVKINGITYPCTIMPYATVDIHGMESENEQSRSCWRNLCDELKILWLKMKYTFLLGFSVREPELPGYGFSSYDKNCRVIRYKKGHYFKNVMTSNILEYELYRAYLKEKKNGKDNAKNILDRLPLRKKIHSLLPEESDGYVYPMYSGNGRFSLMSVQLIIFYKSVKDNCYKFLVRERSKKDVASKNGFFQFIPAGGYELSENSKSKTDEEKYKEGIDPETVCKKEFLEELFNFTAFQGLYRSESSLAMKDLIDSNPYIKYTKDLKPIGISFDFETLRHNLSYALIIDDNGEFERNVVGNLTFNNEFVQNDKITQFSYKKDDLDLLIKSSVIVLTPDSAALYKMFSDEYLGSPSSNKPNG